MGHVRYEDVLSMIAEQFGRLDGQSWRNPSCIAALVYY
jgi:hypothetical protein